MRCPFCSAARTNVVDSRMASEGEQVRRRRQCAECGERFTSYESPELSYPRIVKSDGRREDFNEDKLRAGLQRSLEKRPIKTEEVENAVGRIKRRLRTLGEREIAARSVGDQVMRELQGIDHVAYVRFASVYRNFDDVRGFLDEIRQLENELPPARQQGQLDFLTRGEDEP